MFSYPISCAIWAGVNQGQDLQRRQSPYPGCFGSKVTFQMAATSLSLTLYWKDRAPTQATTPPINGEGEVRRKRTQTWTFSDVSNNRKLAKHVTEYKVFDKNSIC